MILQRPREVIQLERQLTTELKQELPNVLSKFYRYLGCEISIHQLHAIIGGKNNTYTDCVGIQFQDSDEFVAKWLDGLLRRYTLELKEAQLSFRAHPDTAAKHLVELMNDQVVSSYIVKFLRRNFFRQFIPRTRYKPPRNLWSIWFGGGQMTYGLLTSPAYRSQEWTNDISEIRRAPYVYWTVGHVLNAGLVAPEESQGLQFVHISELLKFYRFVLKKLSRSLYEKEIVELYLRYLETSADPLNEPFLIPEFRYGGLEKSHEYRLDFTVFNAHVLRFTGFELSPHSSHGAVRGLKSKKQKDVNAELAVIWEREMEKRNRYFRRFDIPVVTFTDSALADTESCFRVVADYLSERPVKKIILEEVLARFTCRSESEPQCLYK